MIVHDNDSGRWLEFDKPAVVIVYEVERYEPFIMLPFDDDARRRIFAEFTPRAVELLCEMAEIPFDDDVEDE